MRGLRALVLALSEIGVHADLWIDGSFVTKKLSPRDIDVVLYVGEELTKTQFQFIRRLRSKSAANGNYSRTHYGCDFYVTSSESGRVYWLRWYGHDRKNNQKGIIVVHINGGAR